MNTETLPMDTETLPMMSLCLQMPTGIYLCIEKQKKKKLRASVSLWFKNITTQQLQFSVSLLLNLKTPTLYIIKM